LDEGSYLFKIDIHSNVLWSKKFTSEIAHYSNDLIETHDHGLLIYERRDSAGVEKSFLIKTDENGNEEWSMFYNWDSSLFTENTRITKIIKTSDGNYLISEGKSSFTNPLAYIRKVDSNFNEIWTYSSNLFTSSSLMIENNQGEIGIKSASHILKLNSNGDGATYAMIAEQVTNAPGNPLPTTLIEGCGTNGNGSLSLGFMNQFSLGDSDPFFDKDCRVTSAAYDPNDKQGFPNGYGNEHYIRPNQDIEFLIRFQNTGTDTAFTVIVKDEISALLDLTSVKVGASSHPMEWKISEGNTLEFIFNNIMLPDSNINEVASHGFIEFKISQQPDLAEETVINNKAEIYFDFNPPIITNETYHTIGLNFITVSTQNPISNAANILVHPNPFQHQAIFELEKIETSDGLFELFDISGRLAWQQKFSGKQFELKRNDFKSGMYFYKISDNGININSGKIIVD